MIRNVCLLLVVALAVTGAFFAPAASAQGKPTCTFTPATAETPTPAPTSETDAAGTDTTGVTTANATAAAAACADAAAYPGPFTTMPSTPASPYAAPIIVAKSEPVAAPAETTPTPKAGLAHSGSEAFVLAYLGTGLLAFGAVALGIRRGTHIS